MSKEIDEYIRQQNERLAANRAYNESLHPPQPNGSGLFGLVIGVLLGVLFSRTGANKWERLE